MATAQETFKAMIRGGIRPRLRAMGFRGPGPSFAWPARGVIALLGFQKSRHSDSDHVKFTINLTVKSEAAWQKARRAYPYLPQRATPNVRTGVGWESRIGTLLPGGKDYWWSLRADADWSAIAGEIVSAIETYVVPKLRAQVVGPERRRIRRRPRAVEPAT
jgi:hypothetical protein